MKNKLGITKKNACASQSFSLARKTDLAIYGSVGNSPPKNREDIVKGFSWSQIQLYLVQSIIVNMLMAFFLFDFPY